MLRIHHLNQSRSERIVWLAEELGLDYDLVQHRRDPQTIRSPASLWALTPLGKAPVIEDDGNTLFESGAIIDYLLDRYGNGRLRPALDTPEFLHYRYWMHAAEGTLAMPVMFGALMSMARTQDAAIDAYLQNEYRTLFSYLDRELGTAACVAGADFSGADIMVAYLLWVIDGSALDKLGIALPSPLGEYPNVVAYLSRMRARPAHQRALVRMGD